MNLNLALSPELLPATGQTAAAAGSAGVASNPFAALLSGVLGGTQPAPASPAFTLPTGSPAEAETPADPTPVTTSLLALPGVAAPLAAPLANPAAETIGKALPDSGNFLPVEAPDMAGHRVTDETPATKARSPISLADLALSRPLEPASQPAAANATATITGDDSARGAAVVALAGRSLAAAGNLPGDPPPRAPGRAGVTTPTITLPTPVGSDGLTLIQAAGQPIAAVTQDFTRNAGLVDQGTSLLAGQLAAFAAGHDTGRSDSGSAATSAGTIITSGTTSGTTDGSSTALLARLGSTSLPPLQPLGVAGTFAGGLADRLLTLGGPGAHSARLKLHPEHLGELDVEITMDDGTAQVWFGTTTTQARDAIEGSLPRLRELFAEQGIELTRTQIDAGSGQSGQSGFGQERQMAGDAGPWSDDRSWQGGRAGVSTEPDGRAGGMPSARLLDVWA